MGGAGDGGEDEEVVDARDAVGEGVCGGEGAVGVQRGVVGRRVEGRGDIL